MESAARGTVFFDYDGTLHDSMRIYGPAFRRAYDWLVEQGHARPRSFSDDEIRRWLGWTVEDMWTTFMPDLEETVWREASSLIGNTMNDLVEQGSASLFPGVDEMLASLVDRGYELVFLSNCRTKYRDEHLERFGLSRYFREAYCAEQFDEIPKWQIYRQIARNHPRPHAMVGDRFHDMEVALHGDIPSIGCAYGFGDPEELREADIIVNTPMKIMDAVKQLL